MCQGAAHFFAMTRRATGSRVERLEELKGLLKARDHSTAEGLAAELGISRRTLHRDLAILRDSGVPIEAERGRGGGMRLHPNWALGRIYFSTAEAIDLLLSIAIAEQVNSPVLLRHLAGIRRKIVAAFGETHQTRIRSLRKRILLGPPASDRVVASSRAAPPRPLAGLAEAFLNERCAVIEYVDRNGATTSREIEPQFLYLSMPIWYLLAWDRLRGAVRHFRADRIRSVTTLQTTFRLADPRPYVEEIELRLAEL
jgi:predicted DNA-binding transcriptional regulator YafY